MKYAIELLKSKSEEYETLLKTLEGNIQRGAYRTAEEEKLVKSAVSDYQSRLIDVNNAIEKLAI